MSSEKNKGFNFAFYIFIGLVAGVIAGICFQKNPDITVKYIAPFGTIFLNLIKMIVVPVVFLSIIQGVISLSDVKRIGAIGVKTVVYYLVTTCFAVALGLIFANAMKVGSGYVLASDTITAFEGKKAPSFIQTIVNIFPSNIINPLSSAAMLQIIVMALITGIGIIVAGEKAELAGKCVCSFADVAVTIMSLIIRLSPVGVFALICPVIAKNGLSVLLPLLKLICIAYLASIVHMILVYSLSVKAVAKMSPLKFFKAMATPMMFAFSSASSVGTLPLNLAATKKMGVKDEISSFVLPLGATINMDGTAIYQGVCAIFIAQIFGIDLNFSQQLTIIMTTTLASIGTAGVPGAGVIMLSMVLESVGLPLEGIALVAGIDRILDMARTTVNITGDAACSVCVNAIENRKVNR